jgi:hypothetical protein
MDLDWEKLVKRYVWHDERTPYFTRVANLTEVQVRYELFAYAVFMGVLFGALALFSLSPTLPHGDAAVVPIYAFSVLCAAVVLGMTRHPYAALYCAGAPLAALAYVGLFGSGLDEGVLIAGALAWFAYSLRVVAVARAWRRP